MPTIGLEYRYPFINVQPWGTTTVEPIAQVIIRPNEPDAGRLPKRTRKAWCSTPATCSRRQVLRLRPRRGRQPRQCRRPGHHAVRSRGQRQGGVRTILPAVRDELCRGRRRHQHRCRFRPANARSDYVASLAYSPNRTYTFSVRSRMDEATWNIKPVRGPGDRQLRPLVGQPDVRRLCTAAGTRISDAPRGHSRQRVDQGGVELGAPGRGALDLEANKINQYVIGAGYVG